METSVTKRMAKNFSWLSIGDIVGRGLNFLAILYIARVLGVVAFGLLNFAQAFQAYLLIIVDSGLSILATREIAKSKEKAGAISINIMAVRLIIALMVFALAVFILYFVPLSWEMRWLFIGTFLYVFYHAINSDWAFQGLEKMEYVAVSKILYSALFFTVL